MKLFRSKKALAAIVAGSFMFTFAVSSQVSAAPVRVASIPSVDVGDGACDFAANDLGHGSESDPFLVGSASDLAEMRDCYDRTVNITGVSVDAEAGTVTYTTDATDQSFGVGHSVTIASVDPADFNVAYARVTAADATSFTIESDATGTYNSGGTASSDQDFFELTADIDLSVGDEDWNDTSEAAITGVSGDGSTVTYTVDDSTGIEAGDSVIIKGHSVNDFNLGTVTVDSVPDGTTITVANSANTTAGTGGVIVRPGWVNSDLNDAVLDGQGYTISGLTIDASTNELGLFGVVLRSTIRNLNFTGVDIDTTSRDTSSDYVGALAGVLRGSAVGNVSVEGAVVGTNAYTGLVAGNSEHGNWYSINTVGTVSFAAINVTGNQDNDRTPNAVGGVVGRTYYESFVDIESDVDVTGVTESADGTYTVYGNSIGGIIGQNGYSGMRNVVASGDVIGGREIGGAVGDDYCCSYTVNGTASGSVSAYSNSSWGAYRVGGFYGEEGCCSTRDNVVASGDVLVEQTVDGSGNIYYVGGLMGDYDCCGAVMNSSSTGSVTVTNNAANGGISDIGGFMGANTCCGDVVDSYSTGDVTVTNNAGGAYTDEIGGFVGEWSCCGTMRRSYSEGNVTVTVGESSSPARYVGGFIGANYCCGAMEATYATGNVTVNNGQFVGGHTGWSDYGDQFIDSYSTGDVTVGFSGRDGGYRAAVGGFLGYTVNAQELSRVYASGDVVLTTIDGAAEPVTSVGGLIGFTDHRNDTNVTIRDSYFLGSVSGPTYVGGLIGETNPSVSLTLENVYVAASVTASEADAIVDSVFTGPWTDDSDSAFFDSTLAATTSTVSGFNARTTTQMKTEANYTAKGWAFSGDANPWRIDAGTNDGYPYLVPVVLPGRGGGTDWTKVKTLSYAGSKVALTKAKKRALRQAATALIADGCTKVQLRSRPNQNNYDVAAARVKRAHTFLAGVLENRGSDLSIVSNIRVRPNSSNKNTVQVFCGTD